MLKNSMQFGTEYKSLFIASLLFAATVLVAGCGEKTTPAVAASPVSLKGQAPVVPTGDVKGTPEQEAAKQRAISEGPAIEAALKAQQEAPPAAAPK